MRVEFDKDYCGLPHLHIIKVGMVLTFEQSIEQLQKLHDEIGEYLQFHGPIVTVTPAPIADAPKVEGAACIANFTLKTDTTVLGEPVSNTFDPTTVKRNPFYFGDSLICNDPLCKGGCGTFITEPLKLQADGPDNRDYCLVCGTEIPPGPDTCSEGCERIYITSPEYRAKLATKP